MSIVPAPVHVVLGMGSGAADPTGSVEPVESPDLAPVTAWLWQMAERLAGISRPTAPTVVLRIDPDLEPVVATRGVRADGGDRQGEAHRLELSPDLITITGRSAEGVFRGATTLVQLWATGAAGATLEPMMIDDAPRFAWRGLSLDVVRTFHPVETVKTVIDLLSLHKFNVLHLHLTDAEGWRLPVEGYPALIEQASLTAHEGRSGGHYSQDEFDDLVSHAAERFITVVPEFDSPGHTASAIAVIPGLATSAVAAMPESMQHLDPDSEAVWPFVEAVFASFSAATPRAAFVHVGGDEAIAMDEHSFAAYMQRALPAARSTGKSVVAWQETARAGFEPGDLMQWWISPHTVAAIKAAQAAPPGQRGMFDSFPPEVAEAFVKLILQAPDDLPKALEQGADIVLSRADRLYLDTKYPETSSDPAQQDRHRRVGMPVQVYGNGTVAEAFDWTADTLEPSIPADRIAGVEAAMWCEFVEDSDDLFFQLLPRLATVAEKAWSPDTTWDDHRARLRDQAQLWHRLGVPWFASSMVWN